MLTNNRKVPTIAVIGLGNQGEKHLDSILALEKEKLVKLVGLCDVSVKRYLGNKDIPFYSDYRNLYSKLKPDIVIIATPNFLHKKMVIEALNRKIHVIKEKPLAMNYLDAEKLIKTSTDVGKHVLTTQQRFYSPLFLRAKEIIPSLGKIINFSYRFTLNDTVKSWRWDLAKAGGGSWLNMGWHAISITEWLIGDIEAIQLDWKISNRRPWKYKTDHSSFAKIITGNATGSVFLSCAYPRKEESLKIVFPNYTLYLSRSGLKVFNKKSKKIQQNDFKSLNERDMYTLQLRKLFQVLQHNTFDAVADLRTMAIIQAGLNSVNNNSCLAYVEEVTKPRLSHLENNTYAIS